MTRRRWTARSSAGPMRSRAAAVLSGAAAVPSRAVAVPCCAAAVAGWLLGFPLPAAAQRLPPPLVYQAPRIEEPITIDGLADEEVWQSIGWSDPFMDIRGPAHPTLPYYTRVKMAWDETYLYVAAVLQEPHLWATLTERDAIIYHDDDFEVFLDPDGDRLAYYELEINALGTIFDLFLDRPYSEGGHAHIDWDMPGLRSAVFLHGTLNDAADVDEGWSVELAIPWADLVPPPSFASDATADSAAVADGGYRPGAAPEVDDVWWVNFSRVEWPLEVADGAYRKTAVATPDNPHPESNWVWSPQWEINMHVPERWGRVWFVEGR